MGTDIVSWVIIICCIMMSAYFSATETAFSSLNRIRMKNMFSIGELAKYQNISKQTLIFYDKIGLFRPAYEKYGGKGE